MDEQGGYRTRDLFVFHASGIDEEGRIQGELRHTGASPSFTSEPFALGLAGMVEQTTEIFQPAPADPPAGPLHDDCAQVRASGTVVDSDRAEVEPRRPCWQF